MQNETAVVYKHLTSRVRNYSFSTFGSGRYSILLRKQFHAIVNGNLQLSKTTVWMATSHGGRSHMCEGATDIQAHMCFRSWPCRFLCRYAPDTSAPTAIFTLVFKPQNILARHKPRVHGPSRALDSSNRSNIAKILRNWQRLQRPYVCDIARSTGKPVSTPSMFVVAQQQKNPSFPD